MKACEAILIDPVIELAERDANLVKDLGLNLKYASKYLLSIFMRQDYMRQNPIRNTMLVQGWRTS